jgi:hypothetical protein
MRATSAKAARRRRASNARRNARIAITATALTAPEPVTGAILTLARRAALSVQSVATVFVKDVSMMNAAICVSKTRRKQTRKNRNRKPSSRRKRRRSSRPTIRFTPYAWAKLLYLRDAGDTEIGGFAVTSADDPLLVEDVCLVRQRCTSVTVEFDDASVADYFDDQVDAGLKPEQFGRIWVHTHPGVSAEPSSTDEETFDRCFGSVEWAVMFILARGGETCARLRFNVGPRSSQLMNVEVDCSQPFEASNNFEWQREFDGNVQEMRWRDSSSRLADATDGYPNGGPFSIAEDQPLDPFGAELNRDNEEDWFNRLNADPLFLDWEDDECKTLRSTIPG